MSELCQNVTYGYYQNGFSTEKKTQQMSESVSVGGGVEGTMQTHQNQTN